MYACRAAKDSGLFNTVVRYNMRGAHNSVAKRNFNIFNVLTSPDPDSEDLVAICDYVLQKLPNPPQELYLIGYSYGATVAASALQQVPQVGRRWEWQCICCTRGPGWTAVCQQQWPGACGMHCDVRHNVLVAVQYFRAGKQLPQDNGGTPSGSWSTSFVRAQRRQAGERCTCPCAHSGTYARPALGGVISYK